MKSLIKNDSIRIYFCRNAAQGSTIPSAISKMALRSNAIIESMPCSGKIDPRYILKAFESGAEAVAIITCPVEHCRLMEGNLRAARRVHAARELLCEAGLDANCVQLFAPADASDAALEVTIKAVVEFVNDVKSADKVVA